MNIYIKTTETCNLNCQHCFTNGSSGKKIYFDPIKTANWVNQFKDNNNVHFEYHGGEPFLASLDSMYKFYNLTKRDGVTYGMTSNLTLKLDDKKIKFIKEVLGNRIATSWDEGIRWTDDRQYSLWKSNVKKLISLGCEVKLFISMNKQLMSKRPYHIMTIIKSLGIKEVSFERLTHDGNATRDPSIFPTNKEIDDWIWEMHLHHDSDAYYNQLLESVYDKFKSNKFRESTFCRTCEQHIFTINADGTIAGCPNSAPTEHYATIDDSKEKVLSHPGRICMMSTETAVDIRCLGCDLYDVCGGDCYKLEWDEQCPAPRKLMYGLNSKTNRTL